MRTSIATLPVCLLSAAQLLALSPEVVEAQGRGNRGREEAPAAITLSVDVRAQIQVFYSTRPATNVEALPPGIRRQLERGRALPPGITKKAAPPELQASLELPGGFEIVEVGLDVFLVEVATNIIHDVLMDIVR